LSIIIDENTLNMAFIAQTGDVFMRRVAMENNGGKKNVIIALRVKCTRYEMRGSWVAPLRLST